jgi:NAD(P)-dependent dehydrogenase (short-subunit alcohol dehydrogenase family)
MSESTWDEVMDTNAKAVFIGCKEAYPYLIQRPTSVIINIGSFYDKMGVKSNLAYCSSKAAVGAITRCLAVEWASKGVRVLDVAPGYIETALNQDAMKGPLGDFLAKRIPRKTPGSPKDVAALVASLMQPNMSFLTGDTIYIDGAHAIAH